MKTADGLTPKQAAFVREFVKCGNQSEAYRRAFEVKDMKPENVHSRASEIMAKPQVSARVAELLAKANEKAGVTLASHLERLAHLSLTAEGLEQISAAVKAEELRAKASGLYVERVEHSGAAEPVRIVFRIDRPEHDDQSDA